MIFYSKTSSGCENYLQTIRRVYPDLRVTSARLNTHGQNNNILIVNDRYVFRFPKYPQLIDILKVEAEILLASHKHLPLPVPNPEFIHLDGQPVGEAFLGYAMIPGKPLYRDAFQKINDEGTLDAIAEQLAGFLQAMHNLPVSKVF
jgi:aminoglycoside 2''-phosphotransferase